MGKASTQVRIDPELYAAAASVAPVMSRSTTQQICHWARIGKKLEASPNISVDRVASVLGGQASYDFLPEEEQTIVRAFWAERMDAVLSVLRLDRELTAEGLPFVELDEDGAVIRRDPASSRADRLTDS